MTAIKAVVKNGKIELNAPGDWPEGTEVLIEPIPPTGSLGLRDEDWPETAEAINRHLRLMEKIEPLLLTAAEEAEWAAARQARKDLETTQFDDRAEALRRQWE